MIISIEVTMPEIGSKYSRPWRNVIGCTLGILCMYILGVAGGLGVKLAIAFPDAIGIILFLSALLIAAAIRAISEYLCLTKRKGGDFIDVCFDVFLGAVVAAVGAFALQLIMFLTSWPTVLLWYAVSMASIFLFSMPWFNQSKV